MLFTDDINFILAKSLLCHNLNKDQVYQNYLSILQLILKMPKSLEEAAKLNFRFESAEG